MSIGKNMPNGANYELSTKRKNSSRVRYAGAKFDRISSENNATQTLRLLYDGKITSVTSSEPNGEDNMLSQAMEMVKYGSPHSETFAEAADVKDLKLFDSAQLSSKEMIDMAGSFVADLKAIDERLIVECVIDYADEETSLKTSYGFDSNYRTSRWSMMAGISLIQGDDKLDIWQLKRSITPDFDLKKLKDEIAERLDYAKNVVTFEAGAYPVIFSPDEFGFVTNPIVKSLTGTAIYDKVSPWYDKLGQELLDPRFSLVDDGTLERAVASLPFDKEGTPTKRNVLVQNGRIQDMLMDRKIAAKLGKKSSGNATTSGINPHCLIMDAGTKSFDELVKSIDHGLLIDGSMGAWSGNPYAGLVSGTIVMGLKIEKGKIVGRVKDCMYTVNAFEHLSKNLIDFSAERELETGFGSTTLYPYVLLGDVVISTK